MPLELSKLQKLLETPDGRAVRHIIGDPDTLKSAWERGDTVALTDTLERLKQTPEGTRLLNQLAKALNR
ncbi:MAG: hypothetical protein LBN97_05060 [Oscillospiraceae bacterium]|jgi:hypothetical protein|nr:hypothetical protein [Oscillospiraceae bacterium]